MAQTPEGAIKLAARRIGISLSEYIAYMNTGQKWCCVCKSWKNKLTDFKADASRSDGRDAHCAECRRQIYRESYKPKGRQSKKGCRFAPIRDGDKKQARARVNHLVNINLLPDPNDVPCEKCGHTGKGRRHEYHHHRGYAAEFQETVQSLCTRCHAEVHASEGTTTRA